MTDKQQPAQFDWATELSDVQGHVTLSEQEAHEIGARLRSLGAKLKAYEDLGDAADDMASAAAQGFRDGVAPLSANAGEHTSRLAKYVARRKIAKGLAIELIHGFDTNCESEAVLLLSDIEALLAAPPTAQAEGWRPIETAPKDGSYLLLWEQYSDAPFVGYWSGGSWSVSHEHVDAEGGWDGANVVDALSMPITHWMPIPAPPTSAEGVEHG